MTENEHNCRWCDGSGTQWLCIGDGGPDMDEVETHCPECDDGVVTTDVHLEQQDYDESYLDRLQDRLIELYFDRLDDGGC